MDYNKIPTFFENETDSRKKAKETLTKIFENKMLNIDTIKSILTEFHKYENQNSIEVFNRIERNINESEVSTNKIGDVIKSMEEVINRSTDFYKNWSKITAPLNYYGKDLENLMLSKKNVSIMRHNLNIYVKIKDQIKELRDLINANDSNVVVVYKQIRYLAYLRTALLDKINRSVVTRTDKLNNLADHLLCVKQFEEEFFGKFWKYFEQTINWAVEKPEFLVKLLRLIEEDSEYMRNIQNQFQMYNKSDEKFVGLKNIPTSTNINNENIRNSHIRMSTICGDESYNIPEFDMSELLLFKIKDFIDEKFHQAFVDKSELKEILDETQTLVCDLYLVHTKVVPCFPPKYDIFNVYREKYLNNVYEKIQPFMKENYLNENKGNLILFAKWLDAVDESFKKVGIEIRTTEIGSQVEISMHLFYEHVDSILDENIRNILSKNLEDKSQLVGSKNIDLDKLTSFYASDIFRSLFNVIELLSGDIKGKLLYEIVKTVIGKLKEIQGDNDQNLLDLNSPSDLICSCVYTLDAHNCLEIFPEFKKKIKKLLQKEFYDRLKIYFTNSLSIFNNTIRLGCSKSIDLMFIEVENNFLQKIFTVEWNEDVLRGTFETFRTYFNRGFSKILKQQNILLIIVRSFIDNFINYYVEEIIHSVRSLNRKNRIENGVMIKYKLKFIKLSPELVKYSSGAATSFKKDDETYDKKIQNTGNDTSSKHNAHVKVLDKYVKDPNKKDDEQKFKKYDFPVKKFNKESKQYNPAVVFKKIHEDFKIFNNFLSSFKEDTKEPFSKNFSQHLGQNYINTYLNKFNAIMDVLKCSQDSLKDTIPLMFKESFSGEDGKVLLEALLYIREDFKSVTKPDLKKFYLSRYDN